MNYAGILACHDIQALLDVLGVKKSMKPRCTHSKTAWGTGTFADLTAGKSPHVSETVLSHETNKTTETVAQMSPQRCHKG
jgi:hypothetical protein